MKLFNIQMAAQISGVSTHTIRAWEKRYHALKPQRSSTGRRQYSDADIERLSLLSQLTSFGNSISQIAKLTDHELKAILDKVKIGKNSVQQNIKSTLGQVELNPSTTLQNIRMGLSTAKIDIVSHELHKAGKYLAPGVLAKEIITPFLEEIHARRSAGLMTQDIEKSLMAIAKFHISNSLYANSHQGIGKAKVAFATPEGELNPMGIMQAALVCAETKSHFFYLSTNLSPSALANSVNAVGANVIVLGLHNLDFLNESLDKYLDKLSMLINTHSEIWLLGSISQRLKSLQAGQSLKTFESIHQLEESFLQLN